MDLVSFVYVWFILVINSFVFDCLHFIFHRYSLSIHKVHHDFFSSSLTVQKECFFRNLVQHVLLEFLVKLFISMIFLFFIAWQVIAFAVAIEVVIFFYVVYCQGEDFNHQTINNLKRFALRPYVSASYHAMHHIYPEQFFSSYHPLFDFLFGTACPIKNRSFIITGSQGALGQAFVKQLTKLGAKILEPLPNSDAWNNTNLESLMESLKNCDVLVLAHGSKYSNTLENNYISQKYLIDKFIELKQGSHFLPEIWGVGSEIESMPHLNIKSMKPYILSKRAYSRLAVSLYKNKKIIYRHIVPSAFTSKMGLGLMSANITVKVALFGIKRGIRYVPVTYTGLALINYFNFL